MDDGQADKASRDADYVASRLHEHLSAIDLAAANASKANTSNTTTVSPMPPQADDGDLSADMSRSTSQSSLGNQAYATALSTPGVNGLELTSGQSMANPSFLLTQNSSETSSNSSFSRQSSVRSTDSVQAIPLRTPLRSPFHSPVSFTRQAGSGLNYPPFASSSGFTHARTHTESTAVGLLTPQDEFNEGRTSFFPNMASGAVKTDRDSNSSNGTYQAQMHARLSSEQSANNDFGTGRPSSMPPSSIAEIPPPRLADGRIASLPQRIATDPPVPFHISLPAQPGSFAALSSANSLPPTPAGLAHTSLLKPTRPGVLSRSASAMSIGVVVRRSTQDFTFGEIAGEGSYSTVYHVTDKHPPYREYALKILDKRHIVKEKKQKYVNIEKDTLNKLDRHPGIIRLYWTFHDERSLYFVLELAKNGEILKFIKSYGSFTTECARYYAAQILSAIEHMHSRGVIHRDLKPENILLDHDMRVKITDFGTAKILDQKQGSDTILDDRANSFVGTAEYVSPELLSSKTAYRSSDFWAFGCILYQLIAGRPPFKASNEYLTFQKILNLEYTFIDGFPEDARDLITNLLIRDPQMRLGGSQNGGIQAVKQHPFFASINWATIWNEKAPDLATGIVQPAPPVTYPSADGILDYFGLSPAPILRQAESSASSSAGDLPIQPNRPLSYGQTNGNGGDLHQVPDPDPAADKWTACLLPQETVLYTSAVLDKTTLIKKKRQLLLTDYPRLLCLQDAKSKVRTKVEIVLGTKAEPTDGPNNNDSSIETLQKVTEESPKQFKVQTVGLPKSSKSYRFEDLDGKSARWVKAIEQAHCPMQPMPMPMPMLDAAGE